MTGTDADDRPKPRRARRRPEDTRALILGATQRLLAERGPDAIGLKDVARAAGVSHALVSHYFGTLEALIEAAFTAHVRTMRERALRRVAAEPQMGMRGWIDLLFETLGDPLYGRLTAWAIVGRRHESASFFLKQEGGLAQVAEVMATLLPEVPREELELGVVMAMSVAFGYANVGATLWASLGRDPSPERDRALRERLVEMLGDAIARRRGGDGPDGPRGA